jgi:hypothetical protein
VGRKKGPELISPQVLRGIAKKEVSRDNAPNNSRGILLSLSWKSFSLEQSHALSFEFEVTHWLNKYFKYLLPLYLHSSLSAEPPASTKGGNFSNTERTAPYFSSLQLGNPSLSFLFSFTYLQRQSRDGYHTTYSPAVDVLTTVTAVSSVKNVVTVIETTDFVDASLTDIVSVINCSTLFVSVRIVATALAPAGPPLTPSQKSSIPGHIGDALSSPVEVMSPLILRSWISPQ